MPVNVRNFWLELSVDGSKTDVATGPKSKDGGFSLVIKQRDDGGIITALRIYGRSHADGRLELEAIIDDAAIDDSSVDASGRLEVTTQR